MKTIATLLLLLTTPALAEGSMPDFSGAWKRDCEKSYGLQISHTKDNQFSITFCFPAGCNDHAWIAGTAIAGDPKFKVVSESKIGVRRVDRPDAWLTYHRCSRDPASWKGTSSVDRLGEANSDPSPK
ncbi:hypothetical protein [Bradyrhizobium sp. 930_D9_N1_4]|uniref:hypothetical protein n=1 Tax=Bradyrhizobium sp. 930_D9_N1_4 TaxID=3240374 RepID=UPI003F8B321D